MPLSYCSAEVEADISGLISYIITDRGDNSCLWTDLPLAILQYIDYGSLICQDGHWWWDTLVSIKDNKPERWLQLASLPHAILFTSKSRPNNISNTQFGSIPHIFPSQLHDFQCSIYTNTDLRWLQLNQPISTLYGLSSNLLLLPRFGQIDMRPCGIGSILLCKRNKNPGLLVPCTGICK